MKLPLRKRLLFALILCVVMFVVVELGVHMAYFVLKRKTIPLSEYRDSLREITSFIEAGTKLHQNIVGRGGIEILHPYFGFVYDPAMESISDYGFCDDSPPVLPKPANGLVVGVFGGSFAKQMYTYAQYTLVASLKPINDNITVLNFALGGYKQPQQLLVLSYFLSLGAHFDVVINLDGFNEVALPQADNIPYDVFPLFPRAWNLRVVNVLEPHIVPRLAKLYDLRQERKRLARRFLKYHLYHTASTSILWRALDARLAKMIYGLSTYIGDYNSKKPLEPVATGPPFSFSDDADLYDYLATHWRRCSQQMNILCEAYGIRYYHFLQPNQYVPGSKPIGPEEATAAIVDDCKYKSGVLLGYPLLRTEGSEMAGELSFRDLTMIFSETTDVLYNDTCCHLNKKGYEIIADTIGTFIVGNWKTRSMP